ncbi:MAG: hypothetical protein KDB53_05665 [Planctomycetes bacterium]|nr:hypothetical protein [Planctomycetota bacterium]
MDLSVGRSGRTWVVTLPTANELRDTSGWTVALSGKFLLLDSMQWLVADARVPGTHDAEPAPRLYLDPSPGRVASELVEGPPLELPAPWHLFKRDAERIMRGQTLLDAQGQRLNLGRDPQAGPPRWMIAPLGRSFLEHSWAVTLTDLSFE